MARLLRWTYSQNLRKYDNILLAFIWLLGLCCGVVFCRRMQIPLFPMMHGVESCSVSIVCLLSVSLLPFLFSFFAVYIGSYRLLMLLCYIKGCLFAFLSMGILLAYGSAGWLLRLLIMFSDLGCLVPLWWYWLRCREGSFRPAISAS